LNLIVNPVAIFTVSLGVLLAKQTNFTTLKGEQMANFKNYGIGILASLTATWILQIGIIKLYLNYRKMYYFIGKYLYFLNKNNLDIVTDEVFQDSFRAESYLESKYKIQYFFGFIQESLNV
jgi:hypothetical protein